MKRFTIETMVGVFVLIALACVGYLTVKLGKMELVGKDVYHVTARFANIQGLRVGSTVSMSGVEIGRVERIGLDPKDQRAVVTMSVNRGVELTDDVIASVKTSGLIGDKYIMISQGGSPDLLHDGSLITETESVVDIEALISKYVFGSAQKSGGGAGTPAPQPEQP